MVLLSISGFSDFLQKSKAGDLIMEAGVLKYPDLFKIVFFRVRTIHPKMFFFQFFQNTAFLLLYYSGCKKATAMVFI